MNSPATVASFQGTPIRKARGANNQPSSISSFSSGRYQVFDLNAH
ncbi:Uncharacterised protein [Vibrio cholerae]|nr:Uncharacterised protein [Vibrio cholerae]